MYGKKAIITGASSGLGKAMALLFARQGTDLVLVARHIPRLSDTAATCRAEGVLAVPLAADITEPAEVASMAKQAVESLGRIDILVNNAGYGAYGPFAEMPIEEWERMWNVNVRGLVLVTQSILPTFIAQKAGHIVNISSIHGLQTAANASAYCASKFAVMGLTEALSKELWKNGIKVSAICPGGVRTHFLGTSPEEKNSEFMEPEEVAEIVLDVVTAPGKALVTRAVITPRTRPFFVQEIK